MIVLGDLLDPDGWTRPLDRLISEKFEPVLFHVLASEEVDPPAGGDFAFVDSERGAKVEVSLDRRARRAYLARLEAFLESIESYAKKRGLSYVRVEGELALEDALLSYLRAG